MHIISLGILSIALIIVVISWLILIYISKASCHEFICHEFMRMLIPTIILTTWVVLSLVYLPEGEIIKKHKVYEIGNNPKTQVIVLQETQKPIIINPKEAEEPVKIINLNSHFGCYLPFKTSVIRKYSSSTESLGVLYHGTRKDVLLLDTSNNIGVAHNSCNINN